MGDESKDNELKHGNYDPLHATRKPSTADHIDEQPSELAQMPTPGETEHPREEKKRR